MTADRLAALLETALVEFNVVLPVDEARLSEYLAARLTAAGVTVAQPALSSEPDHIFHGLDCWCGPYPDREDPEVIIHRSPIHD